MGRRRGRKLVPIVLSDRQRSQLRAVVRSRRSTPRGRQRARIVLGAGAGRSNRELAAELGCSEDTVSLWRSRFVEGGIARWPTPPQDAESQGRPWRP
jgi:DNA-binding CsgD family transcriptional regulator